MMDAVLRSDLPGDPARRMLERKDASTPPEYYRNLLIFSVLSVSVVAILPLVILTAVSFHQTREAMRTQATSRTVHLATHAKLFLESFLSEQTSALSLLVETEEPSRLQDPERIGELLAKAKRTFPGFTDMGVVDASGKQVAYAGPYDLAGKEYGDQEWFHQVSLRGVHVSEVFLGYRNLPHFVIAVRSEGNGGLVLRATIDSDALVVRLRDLVMDPSGDIFLVNRDGILQTPSRTYGDVLEKCPLRIPAESVHAGAMEVTGPEGEPVHLGCGYIDRSPFVVLLLHRPDVLAGGLGKLGQDLVVFLLISIGVILAVVFSGSMYMVNRTRQSDIRRASLYHKMEYTNKMAAIGRLAAGVAHEINNPIAVIYQKAGLHKDLLSAQGDPPSRKRALELVDDVLQSAERCGVITQRLLGFAKHIDVQRQGIHLETLMKEVMGFLEKEASYRNIKMSLKVEEEVPDVVSDRGQLLQALLNILNNAFAAVDDGGTIEASVKGATGHRVSIVVTDDGVGIPQQDLKRIFEPFFTTHQDTGSGLGLSITYGIIQKLGGTVKVSSTVGRGTTFTVTLPVRSPTV